MRTCWPVASVRTSYAWPPALSMTVQPGVMACRQLSAGPPRPRQPSLNSAGSADARLMSLSAMPSSVASALMAAVTASRLPSVGISAVGWAVSGVAVMSLAPGSVPLG